MANLERENELGFVDIRRTQSSTSGVLGTFSNYQDVATLRSRLSTIDAAYYTATMLDSMTKNDMVYAVRLNDDAAGI